MEYKQDCVRTESQCTGKVERDVCQVRTYGYRSRRREYSRTSGSRLSVQGVPAEDRVQFRDEDIRPGTSETVVKPAGTDGRHRRDGPRQVRSYLYVERWISDFFQNNMWVYSGDGQCYLYRWNGQTDNTNDWNQYTPPAYVPQNDLPVNTASGENVYSGPIDNASSIATQNIGNGEGDDKRTRIYAATKPTIVVDDLYMALLPRDASPDAQNNETNT